MRLMYNIEYLILNLAKDLQLILKNIISTSKNHANKITSKNHAKQSGLKTTLFLTHFFILNSK